MHQSFKKTITNPKYSRLKSLVALSPSRPSIFSVSQVQRNIHLSTPRKFVSFHHRQDSGKFKLIPKGIRKHFPFIKLSLLSFVLIANTSFFRPHPRLFKHLSRLNQSQAEEIIFPKPEEKSWIFRLAYTICASPRGIGSHYGLIVGVSPRKCPSATKGPVVDFAASSCGSGLSISGEIIRIALCVGSHPMRLFQRKSSIIRRIEHETQTRCAPDHPIRSNSVDLILISPLQPWRSLFLRKAPAGKHRPSWRESRMENERKYLKYVTDKLRW